MSEVRGEVEQAVGKAEDVRLTGVLDALGVARSSWYRKPVPEDQRKPPGPAPTTIASYFGLSIMNLPALPHVPQAYSRGAGLSNTAGVAVKPQTGAGIPL